MSVKNAIRELSKKSLSRNEFWINFICHYKLKNICEIGVSEGAFAKHLLHNCSSIQKYYLIDPWKHLLDWNKPANRSNSSFSASYKKTLKNTDFAKNKRVVLKGRTTEVLHKIPDNSLDFVYVDGDHTLRGITIDLIQAYPKVKEGGFIGGDDLFPSIWVHPIKFEPTLVFPFVVHFAEAVSAKIYLLPHQQYLICKETRGTFEVVDLTGKYTDYSIKSQFSFSKVPWAANFKHILGSILRKFFGR